jgi:drug/metabolite transporter (DMT)-like permease
MLLQNKISWRLALGLTLAVVLDTAVQTLWKKASGQLPQVDLASFPAIAHLFLAALGTPLFLAVAILMSAQMLNWLKTLEHADVSFALPITALSYVSVAVVSAGWLKEPLTIGRIGGMALILAGVFLVSRTDPNTIEIDPDQLK